MANTLIQSKNKRPVKPRTQYSPSDPPTTAVYHLVKYNDTDTITIVGSSSVKQQVDKATIILSSNRTAKLLYSGT